MIGCESIVSRLSAPAGIVEAIGLIALLVFLGYWLGDKEIGSWKIPKVELWMSSVALLIFATVIVFHAPLLAPKRCPAAPEWGGEWCGKSNGVSSKTWFEVGCDCKVVGTFENKDGTPYDNSGKFKGSADGRVLSGTFNGRGDGDFHFILDAGGSSWHGTYSFEDRVELPWYGKACAIGP